jgi:SRSO17 transposase
MLPLSRKERGADGRAVDPMHASARHQALHHFVAQAEWSTRRCFDALPVGRAEDGFQQWWLVDHR